MSARTRSSAAVRAASALSPDTRAASRSSQSSPSTATVRASSLAAGPRTASRCRTKRLTAAGPTAWTSSAAAAEGATPAARMAVSSSRTKSGLPPVAAWHARQNSAAASAPRYARVRPVTAVLAQRLREQRDGRGSRGDLRPECAGSLLGRVRRAAGEEQRDRQVLDALREVGQEAQRLAVDPLAVVHEQQQRSAVDEVHDQPVEAVQRLEAGVALDRRPLVDLEEACGGRARHP